MNKVISLVPENLRTKLEGYEESKVLEKDQIDSLREALERGPLEASSRPSRKLSMNLVGECASDYASSIDGTFFQAFAAMGSLYHLKIAEDEKSAGKWKLAIQFFGYYGKLQVNVERSDSAKDELIEIVPNKSRTAEVLISAGDTISATFDSPFVKKFTCQFQTITHDVKTRR